MLKAGASRIKITPPVGVSMAGYANRSGPAEGVHDDLHARALVVTGESKTVALIVAEVLVVLTDIVEEVRRAISAATGLKAEHIIVSSTHTHSGPGGLINLDVHGGALSLAAPFLGPGDATLQNSLKDAMVQAVEQALADQQPVKVAVGVGKVAVGANRRSPDGPADTDAVVMRFDGLDGQMRALLFSQSCHPTVLSADNRLISGDFMGLACQALENATDGLIALGLTGAAGDVSTRFTRRESTFAEAERLAGLLADAVQQTAANLAPTDDERLWINYGQIDLPTAPPFSPEELRQHLAATRQQLDELRNQGATSWQVRLAETAIEGIEFQLTARQGGTMPETFPVPVYAVRIGPTMLLTFPVELFSQLGLMARKAVGEENTMVACYANDYLGYLPTRADFESGGYEVNMALLAAGSGEQLVEYALSLLSGAPAD
jgi:neutral ceramidase